MSLGALLAVIGMILAIFALARPSQRKSISIFISLWPILSGIVLSAVLLVILDVLTQWKIESPSAKFFLGLSAFLIPIGVTAWGLISWHRAVLNKKVDPRFKDFLLSCLRDGVYDEAVRILMINKDRLADALSEDTADLIFDRQFIEAMVRARSWLHLELLANESFLATFPNHYWAVNRTIRAMLGSEYSPLRTAALLGDSGDETLRPTEEDKGLIQRTFQSPEWHHRCSVGYPLTVAACHMIDTGNLDKAYNSANRLYGAQQGITPRSNCQVFLAVKTISNVMKASVAQKVGTTTDIHRDTTNLWDIFRTILRHSNYSQETWDEPFGYGDYPTPFGFLLAEILGEYRWTCREAWDASERGQHSPPDILAPVVRAWAFCLMRFKTDSMMESVSPELITTKVCDLLEMMLELRHTENHAEGCPAKAAWTTMFLDSIKESMTIGRTQSQDFLRGAIEGMDVAKDYISQNREWLKQELDPRLTN